MYIAFVLILQVLLVEYQQRQIYQMFGMMIHEVQVLVQWEEGFEWVLYVVEVRHDETPKIQSHGQKTSLVMMQIGTAGRHLEDL